MPSDRHAQGTEVEDTLGPIQQTQPQVTNTDRQSEPGLEWDIRSLEYVPEVDENLICPICHSPFISPISLQCQHIFCKDCLFQALNHQEDAKSCPSCRGPFDLEFIVVVPKVIHRILDELEVKCPLNSKGCPEILPRGSAQTHLDKYCGYQEVPCVLDTCSQLVPRQLSGETCLHQQAQCPDCLTDISLIAMSSHQADHCDAIELECPDCCTVVSAKSYDEHRAICEDMILHCSASEYGCDFVDKRKETETHQGTCPLAKLAPFITLQNSRLEEHAKALKYLQRKTLLHETFLDTVRDTLAAIPIEELNNQTSHSETTSISEPPFDSPSSHLLSLHETLREELVRVSAAVSDLDAKTDTAFLNSSLRAKEETAHRDAVIAQLRVQVQWLVSSRLQGMHVSRMTSNVLGTSTSRGSDGEDSRLGSSNLPTLTRRGSDGTGIGGREKL